MNYNRHRRTIETTALVTTGALCLFASYRMGVTTGAKLDSMAKDLVAHQLIVVRLRAEHPELVDKAVTETIAAIDGIFAAANL